MSIELDPKAIQKAVVADVADHFINENRGDLRDRITKEIDARIGKIFAEKVEEILDAEIAKTIENGFDRTYQAVDSFGHPKGEPTTIRQRLSKLTGDYWSTKVGSNGKPTESQYNSMSRAEYVMIQACGKDFAEQLKQEAVNVASSLKDGLRAELRKWIDTTLSQLFKVRSADDQAK